MGARPKSARVSICLRRHMLYMYLYMAVLFFFFSLATDVPNPMLGMDEKQRKTCVEVGLMFITYTLNFVIVVMDCVC